MRKGLWKTQEVKGKGKKRFEERRKMGGGKKGARKREVIGRTHMGMKGRHTEEVSSYLASCAGLWTKLVARLGMLGHYQAT
jgi:hypothetical protein